MNPTILQIRTQLVQKEKELKELHIKIQRCIYEIQNNANPFWSDIALIKAEELEQAADELLALKDAYITAEIDIKRLKAELGNG